jgi:carbon storage regulator CsrA
MLVIPRRRGESVRIGDEIVVTLVEIRGDKVRLALTVPKGMSVYRQEVWDALHGPGARAALDPAWLTWRDGAIVRLAWAIAEKGDFEALPVLADALEEAGCDDAEILGHCRSYTPGAGRLWVVDLILASS